MEDVSLKKHDPELYYYIECEKARQFGSIDLIASENFAYSFVQDALGSCLTNKYSEGYPGSRYYGGNEFIDKIENLCRDRALKVYGLDPAQWRANVQAYCHSPANLAVYTGLLETGDGLMGLNLTHGGHITHGFFSEKRKVSASSKYFNSRPYQVNLDTGIIDYEALEEAAMEFKPKLIIAGYSSYPRDLDYKRFREICDKVGAYLHADMSQLSGFVAAKAMNNPFEYADVVSSTTDKSLRGPRSGMIFARTEIADLIDFAVFPMCQGGPHNTQIAALAAQLKQAGTQEFRDYIRQVKLNARTLADELMKRGYKLITDGTDNHIVLMSCIDRGLTGSKMEKACDHVHITLNKNTVIGDKSAVTPGGVRIGTPAVTTRGYMEEDMREVARFLDDLFKICLNIQEETGKKLSDFMKGLE